MLLDRCGNPDVVNRHKQVLTSLCIYLLIMLSENQEYSFFATLYLLY